MLDSMEPHWASNLKDRIKHVSGAPKKLLAICSAQVGMLFVGFYFGRGGAACALQLHGENDVRIDCNRCRALRGSDWQDYFFLGVGIASIFTGAYASIFRSEEYCRIYGMTMLVYSFVIGLTAVLTILELPVLQDAADEVPVMLPDCAVVAGMMLSSARMHAFLYTVNCLLDSAGAVYAMWMKQYFEYELIEEGHKKAVSRQDAFL